MNTEKRSRASRFAIIVSPDVLKKMDRTRSAWYETQEEIEAGLEWGQTKAKLLAWVRRQMRRRLTPYERRAIELYYFKGFTYRQVAARTGTHASSAHRAVSRALRKLRSAASEARAPSLAPRGRRGKGGS